MMQMVIVRDGEYVVVPGLGVFAVEPVDDDGARVPGLTLTYESAYMFVLASGWGVDWTGLLRELARLLATGERRVLDLDDMIARYTISEVTHG